jgi:N-acetylglucosamine kinase-like BadF-type ATPase
MTRYFLGVDVGSSKTHALIASEEGQAVGFGESGAGNHETVGYDGLANALETSVSEALATAGLSRSRIAGAGFGVAGFDWPSEKAATLEAIGKLSLAAPVEAVNDAVLGLLAGAADGWGIAVVAGTGCNCWGRDQGRQRYGHVTGGSLRMGEAAGGGELVARAVQVIAHAWSRRGPATRLTEAFLAYTGLNSASELLQQISADELYLPARLAPLVFEVAAGGDEVAIEVIRWAGSELGELVNAVTRQLNFETATFDVVMVGTLFNGGPLLIEPLRQTIQPVAPYARLMRLTVPPVVGAVVLGMEQAGLAAPAAIRETLERSATVLQTAFRAQQEDTDAHR